MFPPEEADGGQGVPGVGLMPELLWPLPGVDGLELEDPDEDPGLDELLEEPLAVPGRVPHGEPVGDVVEPFGLVVLPGVVAPGFVLPGVVEP
ncbi:MAG TPA: hypothetical protein VN833_25135 [Candidatus Acidoferrales bacterium]|nr:hypothetical protein [Candidatus Acidoferrales bacterium]